MTRGSATREPTMPGMSLGDDGLFLVWGSPGRGPRSRAFARELGIDVSFISATRRRGALMAPYRYLVQGLRTLWILFRRRPRVVFVQSPPSMAVLVVWFYAWLARARFVVDAHSCAMRSVYWTRPRWLYRRLARRAAATIVTSEHYAGSLRDQGGRSLVIRDIPTTLSTDRTFPVDGSFNVMVVNSFGPDEPLDEIVRAASALDDVVFYVTGDASRAGRRIPSAPANVRFTGFLPDASYHALMGASDAVMCLTTHDHTMQRGACEALWTGKPIITSRWPLLQNYFDRGTVHVDNTAASICGAIREIADHRTRYSTEIEQLQADRRLEWNRAVVSLHSLIDGSELRLDEEDATGSIRRTR
jgi:glycosyltransferase involved in cell wall biosynthesis